MYWTNTVGGEQETSKVMNCGGFESFQHLSQPYINTQHQLFLLGHPSLAPHSPIMWMIGHSPLVSQCQLIWWKLLSWSAIRMGQLCFTLWSCSLNTSMTCCSSMSHKGQKDKERYLQTSQATKGNVNINKTRQNERLTIYYWGVKRHHGEQYENQALILESFRICASLIYIDDFDKW